MNLRSLHILVVGAATGGCATALLLARAGATVTLVERYSHRNAAGAGLALAANGRAVLDALGLGPALDTMRESPGARVTNAQGRLLATPPAGARIGLISRTRLQDVLVDAVLAEPGITCRFGTVLERATTDGEVELAHGDHRQTARFDLVIGADGVHSRVRDSASFGARVRHTGIRYLRALVPVLLREAIEAWTPAGIFGAVPMAEGAYVYASCTTPSVVRAIDNSDLNALRAAWRAAYPPAAAMLDAVPRFEDLLIHEVVRVDCATWHQGRLVLVGDAAHAMAPNLGQGANSALVDAAVLVHTLRTAPDIAGALAAYDDRRRPRVRAVADASQRLGSLAELVDPLGRRLRDHVVMPLAGLLPARRQLQVLLQESPDVLTHITRPSS